jgi:hypothetical protein
MHLRVLMEQGLPDTQHLLLACLHDKVETIFADMSTQALILHTVAVLTSWFSNITYSQQPAGTDLSVQHCRRPGRSRSTGICVSTKGSVLKSKVVVVADMLVSLKIVVSRMKMCPNAALRNQIDQS